jgi:hypothetical protein
MENIENPFVSYGKIIQGNKFLGRQSYIKSIEDRLTKTIGQDKGNMALVGYPRIGKSSIAAQAILNIQKELESDKKIPIWINVGLYQSRNDFFIGITRETYYYFEDNNIIINNLEIAFARTQNENQSWSSLIGNIQRFFTILRKSEYSIIFILDEFDYSRVLFYNDANAFQALRDLAYRDFGVNYLITSRRSIREIEIQSAAISTFDGIISKDYVSVYNQYEIEEYYQQFESLEFIFSDTQKEHINFYCGNHPYLLAILGFEIFESIKTKTLLDIHSIFKKVQLNFTDYYEQLVGLLREDGTFSKLLQILLGPQINVKPNDIDELLQYGLIYKGETYFFAYSSHFQGYLKIIERDERIESDTWKLLSETEIMLRKFITSTFIHKFGDNWEENYPQSYHELPKKQALLQDTIKRLQLGYQRDLNEYGNIASNLMLLDQAYITDLFEYFILFSFEDIFANILQENKNYWKEANNVLKKVRNPFAHHKTELLTESEVKSAENYCRKIITLLQPYSNY